MINLLPPDEKDNFLYARKNTHLRKWVFGMVFVLIGMFVFLAAGHVYIANMTNKYQVQVDAARESLKSQQLEETEKRLQDLSNNLKLVIQVLSREILFSKLIRQIGAVMPSGAVLTGIEISKVEGGIDLNAQAVNYDTASRLQVNLQDPNNKLFDKVDIVQIACDPKVDPEYPCKATYRALFTKNNPYLFINNGAKK